MNKATLWDILKSLASLMLLSASIHMVILFVYAFQTQDLKILNYFNILDIDFYFPQIIIMPYTDIISILIMVAITSGFFLYYRSRK